MTPAEQFREVIHKHLGVAPAVVVGDGKAHRFSVNGKKRDDAGEYRFYDDAFAAGYAKDFRNGVYFTWSARGETTVLSDSDRAERDRLMREREEQRERERTDATRLAMLSWQEAKPADPAHPYLARKGVRAHGLRQDGDKLLVPVMDGAELISVQTIAPDGSKLFPLNTRVKGGSFTLGAETDVIYVVEGYATGATVHELTGSQTIIAFNSSNLLAVAPKIRASNYQAHIMIIGDDDFTVDKNPGLRDATKAAKAVGGYLAVPPFDRDAGEDGTDFNDLHALHGSRAVQCAIDAAFDAGPLKGDAEQQPKKEQDSYNPPGEPDREGTKRRFPLVAFDQIIAAGSGSYLVKGLLQRKGLAVFWGPPKCGKSFFVFDLMMHVAIGREYRGHRVKQGTVVYCVLEGAHGFGARVEAFRQRNLEVADASPPFYIMAASLNLIADYNSFVAEIRAQLGSEPPAVVVIDTLNRSLVGSENDDKDMAAYIRASDAIRDAFDCLVTIVHHCGHNGERPRGHSSLIGALDVQVAIWRDKSTNNVVAELEHNKDGETGLKLVSRLEVVEIGLDEDGDAITSLVVIPLERAAPSKQSVEKTPRPPAKSLRLLFECIHQAIDEHGDQFKPYPNGPNVKGVDDEHVRRTYYSRIAEKALPDEDENKLEARKQKSFVRAVKSALDAKNLLAIERNNSRFLWLP